MDANNKIKKWKYPVITMGTFDGVHLGHQKLINTVRDRALRNSGESIIITYYDHPKKTLNQLKTPYLLTEQQSKIKVLKKLGIDHLVLLKFDHTMSLMSAETFLREILYKRFRAKEIVFGYDCHFGHLRKGNYHFLESKKSKYGYTPFLVKPLIIENVVVSSSIIRSQIMIGNVEKAAIFLGRYYDLEGTVIEGHKIGRSLGYPTLNVQPWDKFKLIPADGVYIGRAYLKDRSFFCLTNVGYSPTLKDTNSRLIECHLLEFTINTYNVNIRIEFIKRIRNEKKFANREELISAINKDKEYATSFIRTSNLN